MSSRATHEAQIQGGGNVYLMERLIDLSPSVVPLMRERRGPKEEKLLRCETNKIYMGLVQLNRL